MTNSHESKFLALFDLMVAADIFTKYKFVPNNLNEQL